MYDSTLGKFFTEDPIRTSSSDLNFYRYSENAPVDSADPSGLDSISADWKSTPGATVSWIVQGNNDTFNIGKTIASPGVAFNRGSSRVQLDKAFGGCITSLDALDAVASYYSGSDSLSRLSSPQSERNLLASILKGLCGTQSGMVDSGQLSPLVPYVPTYPSDQLCPVLHAFFEGIDKDLGIHFVVGLVPILGEAVDVGESLTGVNAVTGEKLSTIERIITVIGAFIPLVSSGTLRAALKKFGKKAATKIIQQLVWLCNHLMAAIDTIIKGLKSQYKTLPKNIADIISRLQIQKARLQQLIYDAQDAFYDRFQQLLPKPAFDSGCPAGGNFNMKKADSGGGGSGAGSAGGWGAEGASSGKGAGDSAAGKSCPAPNSDAPPKTTVTPKLATPGGRILTVHAKESLIRHGFKPPFGEIDDIIAQAQWAVKQADGATVHIHKVAGRGRWYRIVVEDCNLIVTALKDLSPHELRNLAKNNGFALPW